MATINAIGNQVVSGNLTVVSGDSVITAGNITLPTTNAGGTQGVLQINSVRWIHVGSNNTDCIFIGNNAGKIAPTNTQVGLIAIGSEAAANVDNSTISANIAIGYQALKATSGTGNVARTVAIGHQALAVANTNTDSCVVIGHQAYSASTGRPLGCIAIGYQALSNAGINNESNYNIAIGHQAGTSLTTTDGNNILISNAGTAGDNNKIRIGTDGSGNKQQNSCYIAGIYGVTPAGTLNAALIDSNGQFGSVASLGIANGGTGAATLTDHGVLLGSGTAAITATAVGATGEIFVGVTGADATWLTAGDANKVLTAHGAGSAVTWETPSGGTWLTKANATADATATVNYAYTINHATPANLLTITLPATAAVGDRVEIVGNTVGMWKLVAAAGDTIKILSSTTSAGGYLLATTQYDCVEVVCTVADTTWVVCKSMGNLTVA